MYVVDIHVPEYENKAYSDYQDNYYEEHAQRNSSGIYSRNYNAPKLKTKTQFLRLKQTEKDIFEKLESVGVEMQDELFIPQKEIELFIQYMKIIQMLLIVLTKCGLKD